MWEGPLCTPLPLICPSEGKGIDQPDPGPDPVIGSERCLLLDPELPNGFVGRLWELGLLGTGGVVPVLPPQYDRSKSMVRMRGSCCGRGPFWGNQLRIRPAVDLDHGLGPDCWLSGFIWV